jgi:hypothetical protein
MRLGVSFIAPRKQGVVGAPFGRQFLPSVVGAPDSPVHHRTWTVHNFFPCLAKATVAAAVPLAHRTVSGAAWWLLALATRRPLIALWYRCRPWRGLCWLTEQSGAHQTVRWILATASLAIPESSEFIDAPACAPDSVRCTRSWCKSGCFSLTPFASFGLDLIEFLELKQACLAHKTND